MSIKIRISIRSIGKLSTTCVFLLLCMLFLWIAFLPAPLIAQGLRIIDSTTDPLTLHPHRSFDPNSDLIISQIYEGLIDYDAHGRLVGRLALRWTKISPVRYRFWLRRAVTFHNGEPFDAYAVKIQSGKANLRPTGQGRPTAGSLSLIFTPRWWIAIRSIW